MIINKFEIIGGKNLLEEQDSGKVQEIQREI